MADQTLSKSARSRNSATQQRRVEFYKLLSKAEAPELTRTHSYSEQSSAWKKRWRNEEARAAKDRRAARIEFERTAKEISGMAKDSLTALRDEVKSLANQLRVASSQTDLL